MMGWQDISEYDDEDGSLIEQRYRFVVPNFVLADLWYYEEKDEWFLELARYDPMGDPDGSLVTDRRTWNSGSAQEAQEKSNAKIAEWLGVLGRSILRQQQMHATDDPPPFTYFQTKNGPMFCWTTEKDTTSSDSDDRGWYYSFVYKPTGSGARTGKANSWLMVERSLSRHRKRKDAKARCEKLYDKWAKTGRLPV